MPGLTTDQRAAIFNRYGGLVRTYFSEQAMHEVRFAYRSRLDPTDVEFYAYLRLASVLAAGCRLPLILERITLAPSFNQERVLVESRGGIEGRLAVHSYLRRRGRRVIPQTFPNWRVRSTYSTPENALAAAAACSLLSELQILAMQLPIEGTREAILVREISDAVEKALRDPALGEALGMPLPEITSVDAESLFARVAERWQTRRISNLAYLELWRWADDFRKRGLAADGILTGLAYSDDFDNRLFEIFSLASVGDALKALGFEERVARPLHERSKGPVFEMAHPDAGLTVSVFFQKGDGVLWTSGAPREWEKLAGVPDIVVAPDSTRLPVMIIDAKNRYRGSELEASFAEEAYKMLGYFENFSRQMRIQGRGPIGGLIFLSRQGSGPIRRYKSRSGGVLVAAALDPCDQGPDGSSGARPLLEEMLRSVGLLGGRPDVTSALQEIKESVWGTGGQVVNAEAEVEAEDRVLARVHELVVAQYGIPGPALREAHQALELHLLGSIWSKLDDDVQSLLATSEVFWAQHHLGFGMDFAPVVVELSRAMEIIISRMLFEPFRRWADARGLPSGASSLTLGQMRAMVERAKAVATGSSRSAEAAALHDFLSTHGVTAYAYGEFLDEVHFVNLLRRRAAHKAIVTGSEAGELRNRMLGVGSANPILAKLLMNLAPLRNL